jgi:hypothetical protein
MANKNEKSSQRGQQDIGNQQGTAQTGGQNSGGQLREHGPDTSRTSNEGRKQASGGNKNTNNRGQERE